MAFAFVHKNEWIRNVVQWVEKQVQIRKKIVHFIERGVRFKKSD
jgi:hypothetical protein